MSRTTIAPGTRTARLKAALVTGAVALAGSGLPAGNAAAEPVTLRLLHVNDVYEYEPRQGQGGLAELGTLLDAERAKGGATLFTFGGDLLSPSLASNMTRGKHMVAFFNALGLDVAVLGNHEFDFGSKVLVERAGESRFPWLAANVQAPGGGPLPWVKPSVVREVGGLKVGLVGLLTAETASIMSLEGVAVVAEEPATQAAIDAVRKAGADVVVLLTHVTLDRDRELARRLKGVDVMLGGHDHEPASVIENGVLVFKAGIDAHWLGVVEVAVDPARRLEDGRAWVGPPSWRFVSTAGVAPSPAITPMVTEANAALDQGLGQSVGTLGAPLDSRTEIVRSQETAIGNLFADALRANLAADVALINGGGLRGNRVYDTGTTVTRRDVVAEMPFGNIVMAVEISGTDLREALEYGLSAIERKAGRFPQVSGMRVSYDPSAAAGQRIRTVSVGDKPLDPAGRYRLATTDYLARGGDGYGALARAKVVVDASGGPMLANVVADHLAAVKGPVAARVEGRLAAAAGK